MGQEDRWPPTPAWDLPAPGSPAQRQGPGLSRHMTVSCVFFIGRIQKTGQTAIKLTGLTFDFRGEINLKPVVRCLAEGAKL